MATRRAPLLDRLLSRVGLARTSTASARGYAGAAVTRLTQDWYASTQSADQEIKGDLRRLRAASRALVRDNAYARRYVGMVAENVVGPYGIKLQAKAGSTRRELNEGLNEKIERAWRLWGLPEHASLDGRLSWTGVQQLIARTLPQDGEVFLRLRAGADNPFGFAVEVLDADLVDHEFTVAPEKNPAGTGNGVVMGVEVTRYGRAVAYWTWTVHPSEFGPLGASRERVRIPASEMLHLYLVERPGQTRGVPWFAPILFDQKMMAAYQEAEITAARIGASNVAAIQLDPDKMVGAPEEPAAGAYSVERELEPASVWRLNPGESLVSTNFDHPSTAFAPFVKAILRSIATGLGVSYTSLTGDLEAVNYSSIRAGLLQERDAWRSLQEWITDHCHRRVFAAWLPFAALGGFVPARESQTLDAESVRWLPRGWAWVDPLKDMEAAAMAVREGFTTRSAVCAEQGDDFRDHLAALAEEQAAADAAGVTLGEPEPVPGGGASAESSAPPARALRLARHLR